MNKSFMKVSEFLSFNVNPFVLGAFFSRYVFINDNKYIVTLGSYKKSSKVNVPDFDYKNYIKKYVDILNEESKPNNNWLLRKDVDSKLHLPAGRMFFVLENDININEDSFFNKLYAKLLSSCSWLFTEEISKEKKSFIRGYMELRGSIDTTADYVSQDYFYNSQFEIRKARILIDYMNVPHYIVNINFRQLQKQYYTNVNRRNPQLRLNIFWYMHNIGMLNEYKARIFMQSRNISEFNLIGNVFYFKDDEVNHRNSNLLDERLNYYSTKVFGKGINQDDISKMRSELGFDGPLKSIRSSALVETIRFFTPDECMGCKNYYKTEDRTFINKKTGRPYFEIHHMISLGNNKELDDENNMLKLCSTCHNTLKKGAAEPEVQKALIAEIYKNAPKSLEFSEHFFDTKDFSEIVEKTFKSLK